ncbi:hypothetical protein EOI86_07120 [Hwanghaeella grinnelliae]|uniref:Ubiquitin-activating enzyme E1 FCCH domain-containing protein n=1 Tax=Hwanghaeella grinnelliae TaxID=2500179 RepID=A0A3S2WUU6_9PROT|nr:hypothetical protein [Hwanghaeella grinnelliae]RVU39021.1 hypothetical protein EOI86_07120 [Hwanghaeella grinnelliae]
MVARTHVTQFSFDKGIIDEDLLGRRDIKAYPGGLRQAKNMIGVIGGPISRRGGLAFVAELPSSAGDGARLAAFHFRLEQIYLLAFLDETARIYKDDALQAELAMPYGGAQLAALDFDQSLDTMLLTHEEVEPKQLQRQGSHSDWALNPIAFRNLPTHPFSGPTAGQATPSGTTGAVTVTSTAEDFTVAAVGDVVRLNGGRITITSITGDTEVAGTTQEDLDDTKVAEAGAWSVEQQAWSDAKGYPRSVHLDGNRSFWGGSKDLLQRVWGSASGGVDLFDFFETKDRLDDEFVEDDLVGSQVNAVSHIHALGDQFFFTSGGVFVNRVTDDSPVTVENFHPRKHFPTPIAPVKPVASDGAVVCVTADGAGRAVGCAEVVFDVGSDGYIASDLNILSASVMREPVDMAARASDGVRGAHHRFVVNTDGTVAVHHSLRRQEVSGWTLWESAGLSADDAVLKVAVVGNTPYFLVRRTIDGATRYFIEKHALDRMFDSSVKARFQEPSDTLDGLDHLEGLQVQVFADGALRDPAVVTDGTVAVTDGGAAFPAMEVEAGMPFDWVVEPLPVEAQIAEGTLVGQKHRLIAVTLELKDAYPFEVNGRPVNFRRFGEFRLDEAPKPFSGRKRRRFLGWNRGQGASFTASGTLPATFLSAVAEVGQ